MLPLLLGEVRSLVGERRVTVVFDRGGYSPQLFGTLIGDGFDILPYRKGRVPRVSKKKFQEHKLVVAGREVTYKLADQGVRLLRGKLRLRQVTRLSDNGHQTPILTSRRDLSAGEVAFRMFERWRQENFFKYLREEYALDVLVDYLHAGGAIGAIGTISGVEVDLEGSLEALVRTSPGSNAASDFVHRGFARIRWRHSGYAETAMPRSAKS